MSQVIDVDSLAKCFESLTDPRHEKNRHHVLAEVLVIFVCGVLCQATGPTSIARWANSRADWLARYLTLPYGIPSRDCIRR